MTADERRAAKEACEELVEAEKYPGDSMVDTEAFKRRALARRVFDAVSRTALPAAVADSERLASVCAALGATPETVVEVATDCKRAFDALPDCPPMEGKCLAPERCNGGGNGAGYVVDCGHNIGGLSTEKWNKMTGHTPDKQGA